MYMPQNKSITRSLILGNHGVYVNTMAINHYVLDLGKYFTESPERRVYK